jgi:hypothetical protein
VLAAGMLPAVPISWTVCMSGDVLQVGWPAYVAFLALALAALRLGS